MRLRLVKKWSTHMPLLMKAVNMCKGPVLEMGSGIFSTPVLHWMCRENGLRLVTYENNADYLKMAMSFADDGHEVHFVEDWDKADIDGKDMHWGAVLIDHAPEERRIADILRLKDKADLIVIHDTDCEEQYGYQKVWPHFKYRHDWKECKPWATVVSNFNDLSGFKQAIK